MTTGGFRPRMMMLGNHSQGCHFEIRRILVDTGNSTDVLFEDTFEKLCIDKERPTPINTPLMCFSGESLLPTRKVIPFGLKNTDATYQRLANEVFKDQLNQNVEAYVDDMVVKSKKAEHHLTDLK
ncbi:PREDICTED: uncharacterized protein LOC104587294 [Nelumbo nucifera]|uniref:Uncharacterized protein LOC104587294 n=1 Tax=Nelumbo nucifera TaxID=4432 RepID=A0A1U7Z808_NELNU|nr:PREDICTED: uncharacterized protein LOC104587294 [Nelumbo nucifera]